MPVTTCIFLLQRFSYEAESEAYKYLANYHLKQGNLDAAQAASQKCSEFTEVMTHIHTAWRHKKVLPKHKGPVSLNFIGNSYTVIPVLSGHSKRR